MPDADSITAPSPPEASPGRVWRVLRRLLLIVGGLIGLVGAVVLLVLLLLQTDWGSATAGRLILQAADPFPAARLSVGSFEGNWVRRLELRDVDVVRDDSVRMVHVDRSPQDLIEKLEAVRLLCREVGCAMRYLTHDGLAAARLGIHAVAARDPPATAATRRG